jgi:hypothetical protein
MIPSSFSPLFSSLHKLSFSTEQNINTKIVKAFNQAFPQLGLQQFNNQDIFIYREPSDQFSWETLVIATGSGKKRIDALLKAFITEVILPNTAIAKKHYRVSNHELGSKNLRVGGFAKGVWNGQESVAVIQGYNHYGIDGRLFSPTGESLSFTPQTTQASFTLDADDKIARKDMYSNLPDPKTIHTLIKKALKS